MGRTSFFVLRGRKEVVSGNNLWVRGYVRQLEINTPPFCEELLFVFDFVAQGA